MTFADQIDAYLKHVQATNAPATLENYTQRLHRFEAFARGRRITKSLCQQYYLYLRLEEKLSARTVVLYRRCVRTFFNWLVDHEMAKANPVTKLEKVVVTKTERPTFTIEELGRIRAKADTDWSYAIECAYETGLRLGDVAMLRWTDILVEQRGISRVPNKTKRFEKKVEIPISEPFLQKLTEMMVAAGDNPFVCPWMAAQYQSDGHKTLSSQFIRLCAKANVFGKSFHCLRHTRITKWLKEGVRPEIISTMTGQTLQQVMEYVHLSLDDKRLAMAQNTQSTHYEHHALG